MWNCGERLKCKLQEGKWMTVKVLSGWTVAAGHGSSEGRFYSEVMVAVEWIVGAVKVVMRPAPRTVYGLDRGWTAPPLSEGEGGGKRQ
eukprot:1493101-Amphidinium_carterae.2